MAPIKRHPALQSLSREHHHTLLLSWKIKNGLAKGVDVNRIKKYCDWYYEDHLLPHFKVEEKELEKIVDNTHPLMQQMKQEHQRIITLFEHPADKNTFAEIVEVLHNHIRFEERVLFNEIQNIATEQQLQAFADAHQDERFVENIEDEFWK
ncbi:hypothetical protein ACFSPU_11265 [Haoranjiania flava]|uniref:Hemerythrin domain-containing protein n=1 Tax=Haoranjiania flava TaxID=1856322 RepID=A0AAE3IK74_9BACT|nr:hypothetical protein [Haoranjiania flava]MCU7693610.1 hypothetical protein [Haoranjiania flava]